MSRSLLPRPTEFSLAPGCPLKHTFHCIRRKTAVENHERFDSDSGLTVGLARVKVRRNMIVVVNIDRDTVDTADTRQSHSLAGRFGRERVTGPASTPGFLRISVGSLAIIRHVHVFEGEDPDGV